METTTKIDPVTETACMWLLAGGEPGGYRGPRPDPSHDLAPLLSRETGNEELDLLSSARWFRLEQSLRPVLERLQLMGLHAWAHKGFDLARSVYPFPGARPMSDADLVVEPRFRQSVCAAFTALGWSRMTPGDGVFSSGIVSEMKMLRNGVMAEVHSHVFYFPATFPGRLPTDLFLGGRLLEPGLMGFSWHNTLLLVLLHMITNSTLRPVWWADVCLLAVRVQSASTWEQLAVNAAATGLGRAIAPHLAVAADLGAPVPPGVIRTLENTGTGREYVLKPLKRRGGVPTVYNLLRLHGWKRLSWLVGMSMLACTGSQPLREH